MSRPHLKSARRPVIAGSYLLGSVDLPSNLCLELGKAVSVWGYLEQQFDALLSISSGSQGLGRAIRKAIRAAKTRRVLLAEIAREAMAQEDRAVVEPLLARYGALATERNIYVHSVWGTHTSYPEEAIILRNDAIIETQHFDIHETLEARRDTMASEIVLVSERDLRRFSAEVTKLSGEMLVAFYAIQGRRMKAAMGLSQ